MSANRTSFSTRARKLFVYVRAWAAVLALVGATLVVAAPSDGANASSIVTAQVATATTLDMTGCTGPSLSLGTLQIGTTSVGSTACTISFGSSNNSAALRLTQSDHSGAALTQFQPAKSIYRGSPKWLGAAAKSASEAWMVGQALKPGDLTPIIHTINGGATWTTQNSCNPATRLDAIAYVSANTLIAVGNSNVVCRTYDGGDNWVTVTTPTAGAWRTISMLPSGEGWIAGWAGKMLHTNDGGVTWIELTGASPTWNIGHIVAASSTRLYAAAYTDPPYPDTYALASDDGGITWKTPFNTGNTYVSGFSWAVAALDATHAVVGGSYGTFLTQDGGTTWTKQSGTTSLCLAAFDSQTVASYYIGAPKRSTDGGVTWSTVSPSPSFTGQIWACAAASATAGFIGGYNDQRLSTVDAGQSYTRTPSTARDQRGVAAWSRDAFVTVGDEGSIRRSIDRGVTVTESSSGSSADLRDVAAFGDGLAVAVGASGTILRSVDYGATWTSVTSGTAAMLYAVDVSHEGTLVAVGAGGTVLRSSDSGLSWQMQSAPAGITLMGVAAVGQGSVPGSGVIWVVGTAGGIFRSDDWGATWTSQTSGTTLDLLSIDAIDETTALATTQVDAANLSGVLRTTNSGATWSLTMGSARGYAVEFVDANVAFISTSGGYRRSVDGGITWTNISTVSNIYSIEALDDNTLLFGAQSDVIGAIAPAKEIPDFSSGVTDFTGSTGAFGACLETVANTLTTGWPLAGSGNCVAASPTLWRGIAQNLSDATADVATTSTSSIATASFVFAARPGATQPPGAYSAGLEFSVLAPG